MAKKHKPKGGHQQKPHKRKSFRDNFSRESSGPPTPHFSLRDEVLNTERHHSEWTPAAKLRLRPVAFVSAGSIQPLEEPESRDKTDATETPDSSLDQELAQNEGAMADLNIDTSEDISPEPIIEAAMVVDETIAELPADELSHTAEDSPSSFFVVDSVGDKSLKPSGVAPVMRETTPDVQSESEDEVILFHGRGKRITVQDDPMPVQPPKKARSPTPPKHITAPAAALTKSKAKPTGRRKPGRHLNARKSQPRYDDEDDDDIDPAILQDYLENISGGEELVSAALAASAGVADDDEWTSSEMDDEQADADMTHDAAFDAAMKNIVFESTGEDEDEDGDEEDEEDDSQIGDEIEIDFEAGSSDPGDDSELESDLEYTERERWEDEEDIRQRQIDALTDEEIARILAKQEDLGMGSDEILLLDDSGFVDEIEHAQAGLDAILADPNHPLNPSRRNKKKGRRSDVFPSASALADAVEQDPYGGFDVMDFDRPSLRATTKGKNGRKSAGPIPEALLDLSDSDMVDELQASWATDRKKKAAKKAEREELRREGLLGRKNKFKPDLATKFSDGMSLSAVRDEIQEFLENPVNTTKAFPPMEKRERKILHEIAHLFELTSVSRGSGKNRFTVLTKRQRTPTWFSDERWQRALRIADRGYLRPAGKGRSGVTTSRAGRGGGIGNVGTYANGEVVGAAAPEIAASSFGHKMLLKMGWEKGMSLGKDGDGRLTPVEAVIKSGRGGLG